MKTISIDGVIGWDIFAADVRAAIREANGDDITFELNSPGGLVTEGIAMHNAIKSATGDTIMDIVGLAASMGSYVALAAKKVTARPNAIYMIHNANMIAIGDHNALRKSADIAEGMSKILAAAYVAKTGKNPDEIRSMMDEETFLFGSEIKSAGFADEITGESTDSGDKAEAVLKTRAAVASADDLIKRLCTEADTDQAAACLAEMLPRQSPAVGGVQAAGPKPKKEVSKMTQEEIDALKAQAYQDGINAERSRVAGLEAWAGINADVDKIIAETKASGKRYEDVASQLNAAAAKGKGAPAANGENAPTVVSGVAGNVSGVTGELDAIDHEAAKMFGYTAEDAKKFGKGAK